MATKDWKAECDKLRGELTEMRRQVERLERDRIDRWERDSQVSDKFKELLLEVLGS